MESPPSLRSKTTDDLYKKSPALKKTVGNDGKQVVTHEISIIRTPEYILLPEQYLRKDSIVEDNMESPPPESVTITVGNVYINCT
jgi:hypothetical protein